MSMFGFLLSLCTIYYSLSLLNQSTALYYDLVALSMVAGGTFCVFLMTFPVRHLPGLFRLVFSRTPRGLDAELVAQFVNLARLAQSAPGRIAVALENPAVDPYVKEGIELILGGFSYEDIEMILSERLYTRRVDGEQTVNLLKSLSKYPPAFGLMGTVLGLVSVMRSLGEGATPEETGLKMAVALVSTLYGLVLANLLLLPASEGLLSKVRERVRLDKFLIEGVLHLSERASPLLVQEALNSYLTRERRKDIVGIGAAGAQKTAERGAA